MSPSILILWPSYEPTKGKKISSWGWIRDPSNSAEFWKSTNSNNILILLLDFWILTEFGRKSADFLRTFYWLQSVHANAKGSGRGWARVFNTRIRVLEHQYVNQEAQPRKNQSFQLSTFKSLTLYSLRLFVCLRTYWRKLILQPVPPANLRSLVVVSANETKKLSQ